MLSRAPLPVFGCLRKFRYIDQQDAGHCQIGDIAIHIIDPEAGLDSRIGAIQRGQFRRVIDENPARAVIGVMPSLQYFNGFCNPRRRHSALGWKSPVAFERKIA